MCVIALRYHSPMLAYLSYFTLAIQYMLKIDNEILSTTSVLHKGSPF